MGQWVSLVPALNTAILPGGRTGRVICAGVAMPSIATRPENRNVFFIGCDFYFKNNAL
jgi:hypothetical protein